MLEVLGELLLKLQILLADRYSNSIYELLIFCILLASLFLWIHWQKNSRARKHRAAIPLVIGGWGSRGKSGTERLKAALINAMGRSLISKTSGCEPVILYSNSWEKLEEIPLHRPAGKATIWEQTDVLKIANSKNIDVFLWECMGLEPDYVRIMQRDWMQDDISTITNTYPDHEDIQGPSGLDVAQSIASFIGKGSKLVSSENLMNAVLDDRCKKQQSELITVDEGVQYLVTEDVMARFPYSEHPNNVALVLQLALELGMDRDMALKEMADRVYPDIGVLKTYPEALVHGIRIEFSNGFSANERYASLSNWQRLGFDQHDLEKSPETWISIMVNNREDRVARSKVFADMIVQELELDEIYLVGTNLDGFRRFYRQAIQNYLQTWKCHSREQIISSFQQLRRRLRVPESMSSLIRRLLAGNKCLQLESEVERFSRILANAMEQNDDKYFYRHWELDDARKAILESFIKWENLLKLIQQSPDNGLTKAADELFNLVHADFEGKLICISDEIQADASALLSFVSQRTPKNFFHRMLGMQNIKGVGLRWLEMWERYEREGVLPQNQTMAATRSKNRKISRLGVPLKAFSMPIRELKRSIIIRRAYRRFERGSLNPMDLRQLIRSNEL